MRRMSERLSRELRVLQDAVKRRTTSPDEIRHLAETLLFQYRSGASSHGEAAVMPLAFYAACLFVYETCPPPPYSGAAYAEHDRRYALTLFNTAAIIPREDAALQLASPVDELCKWALDAQADPEAPILLAHLVYALFNRSDVGDALPNAFHALGDMLQALEDKEDAAQLRERTETLKRCMSIDFRSARYGDTLSLQNEARSYHPHAPPQHAPRTGANRGASY
jgi:hypothetical protein